jgi:RHS repeat-associated protein
VKKEAGATTRYIFSGTKVIAEYVNGAAVGSPTKEYIYSGSALLATIEGGTTTTYHHQDHLSVRLTTDAQGTKIGEQGNYPFGEFWYSSSTTTKWRFTSYERDAESGNDYAIHRYYSNRLGRFQTPDPLAGSVFNPQSLNRYAYVLNDPINLADPLGLCPPGVVCTTIEVGGTQPPPIEPITVPLPGADELTPAPQSTGGGSGVGSDLTNGIGGFVLAGILNSAGPHLLAPLDPPNEDPLAGKLTGGVFIPDQEKAEKAEETRAAVLNILSGENDCANFFAEAVSNPAEIFGQVQIRLGSSLPARTPAATTQGTFANSTIFLNPNGQFFSAVTGGGSGVQAGALRAVGSFSPMSPQARMSIMLHEFAHNVNAVPSDKRNPAQSAKNTKTIENNCGEAIKQAAGGG